MKTTKKVISLVLTLALVVTMFSVAVFSASAAPWNNYSKAAAALDTDYAYDGELGAIYSPESTTFKVWAPLATQVALNLYATGSDKEEGAQNLGTTDMEKLMDGDTWTGVWTATVEGDKAGTYYTYTITNPDHIYNSSKTVTRETQDVYSHAVGVNGDRSMVVDLDSTDPAGWENDSHVFTDQQTDAIIWEVQVKDFSFNENSGVSDANRGKFLAFTETGTTLNGEGQIATCIDYLKSLGITHVQINPFYDFATVNEAIDTTNQFNWGYDPKNYGVPEGSFSSNPFDGNVRINECKQMIQALHNAGIGVIMDVVYNHTYSYDSCFTCSVPEYYYRMTASGGYSNQSGCGNDTASERAMYRKYMRDMLAYWTNEYHIDGYRFDLMGVHDGETMTMIREDMDAIDSRIIMYGEGWSGGTVFDPKTCSGTDTYMCTQDNAKKLPSRIGFFNDQIRDGIKGGVFDGATAKGFVNSKLNCRPDVAFGIRANSVGSARWRSTAPEQTVTYASCHDNMTLYDKLAAADQKTESIDYRKRYAGAIKANKLASAIINSSQGIDFMLAGEEMGRSKDGDENSYKSAPTLNMIDWSLLVTNADLVSYYKGMIELRKAFSPITAARSDTDDDSYEFTFSESPGSTGYYICYEVDSTVEGEWNKVAFLFNGRDIDATLKLKATDTTTEDTEWVIIADGTVAGVTAIGENKGLSFNVPACSAVIAVEKNTFEAANVQSDFGKVNVSNVDGKGNLLSSYTLIGSVGEGYQTSPDNAIPIKYDLKSVDGAESGVFTKEEQAVTYHFGDFVPSSLQVPNGDVDDDGVLSIIDATRIQKHLAQLKMLDDEHLKRGDYDYDKVTSVIDATLLQKFLAGMNVAIRTVTTNYIGTNESGVDKRIASSVVKEYRLGTEYTTEPLAVAYYALDETPANASGVVSADTTVTYHYTYHVDDVVIHVKHGGDLDWTPYLWAWGRGTTDVPAYSSWPGYAMKDADENGWATTTFPVPGGLDYYIIISNNGSDQTSDVGPIKFADYPEIWVVIDDANVENGTEFIKYYNYNPDIEN
ncbi:MAG: type I pullulanase [Ruminococcus sp.]|nr:type I pullulanase [Ruminococcus sp.]